DPAGADADLSVTICQIMALRGARNAGFLVPKNVVENCTKYVLNCRNGDGTFRYVARAGHSSFPLTAAGVVALYSAGIYKGKEIEDALKQLNQHRPGAGGRGWDQWLARYYFYGHYYAAQAMWTAGGELWDNWYAAISNELLSKQDRVSGNWTDHVCPHFATSMACIILQIPHAYLPILQK